MSNKKMAWFRRDPMALRVFISEFIGTAFLVVIVTCGACQVVLSRGQSGNVITAYLGTVFAVTFAVYVSFKGSGGHINPIVTTVFVALGNTQKRLLLVYWAAQYIGAFVGATTAYGIHYDALNKFDGGNRTLFGENGSGSIFSSFPQNEDISIATCIFDATLSSAILIIGILTITDQSNMQLPPLLMPPLAGVLVGMIVTSLNHNCNAPLNPAKDFSSRVFMAIAGWGTEPFSHRNYTWFIVPLIVPHIGALFGMLVYKAIAKAVLVPVRVEELRDEEVKLPPESGAVLAKLWDEKPL